MTLNKNFKYNFNLVKRDVNIDKSIRRIDCKNGAKEKRIRTSNLKKAITMSNFKELGRLMKETRNCWKAKLQY